MPTLDQPLAYLNGQAVLPAQLRPGLIEAAGGQILAERVIDQGVAARLAQQGLKIEPADITAEQNILLQALNPDPQQAQRLLNELRSLRGLGPTRYAAMLRRNAGLRLLVRDQAAPTEPAIRDEFQLEYGPRFEARIIVVDTLAKAGEMEKTLQAGVSFIDLAIANSTDSSRAQGGLLPLISPVDPLYPLAVREALGALKPGQISPPVALAGGFAVLKLEKKTEARPVRFDDVKKTLALHVRRRNERMLMQQVVRDIINKADLTILDPALDASYAEHKKLLTQ